MVREPRVCIKGLRAPFFAAAARTGRPLPELAARVDVAPAILGDTTARIPHATAVRVWDDFAALAGEESFGLFAVRLFDAAPFDLVDLALQHSATLGDMTRKFMRYQTLFHDANDATVEVAGDRTVMRHRLRGALPRSRHLTEFILAMWVTRGRRVSGGAFAPIEVRFRHRAPADLRAHHAIFGPRVGFDADDDALILRTADWELPLVTADPSLHATLLHQLELEQRGADGDGAFVQQVREAIRDRLLAGDPEMAGVARALAVSERTLQRRLQESQQSFRGLVDDVRREVALAQLGAGATTVTDLAFLLGFADLSAFSRAFRRWTGTTPQQFRRGAA